MFGGRDWGAGGKWYRVSIIGDDHQPSHRYIPVLYWYQLLNIPNWSWYQGGPIFSHTWEELVLGTILKLTSWVLVLVPKADFCLVYCSMNLVLGQI